MIDQIGNVCNVAAALFDCNELRIKCKRRNRVAFNVDTCSSRNIVKNDGAIGGGRNGLEMLQYS